jgi:hypothetical protein
MVVTTGVTGPADWRGDEIAGSDRWRYPLGDDERAELLAAVRAAEAAGVPLEQVTPEVFRLPTLTGRLGRLAGQVADGCGFALLSGVPVDGLTGRQGEILAVGVACHVGRVVGQGPRRVPVLHVRDQGADPARPTTRSHQHNRRLGFHADPTDVVALLCLRPARAGGHSPVVSSVAVHNEIVRTRPDLARVLYQPWWHDRRTGDGPDSFHQQPVYRIDGDGRLVAHYGPDYIRSAQRGAHVPPLSAAQEAAMELVDRLNDELMFTMELRAGDMQFLNNAVVLHGRTAYEDNPEPQRRRDLIRVWLDRPDRRPGA